MLYAQALGLDALAGTLEPGRRADLIAVPLDAAGPADPLENILASANPPSAVYVAGEMFDQQNG